MQRQRLIWFWIQTKIICRDLPAEPPDEFYLYESEGWRRDGGGGWEGAVGRKGVARRGIRPVRKPEACAMSFSLAAEPTKLIFNFLSLIRRGSSYGPLGLYATARGFIALVAERTRCSIVSRLYYIATRNTVLSSLPFPPDPWLRQRATYGSSGARPPATTRTCQHGELTAQ